MPSNKKPLRETAGNWGKSPNPRALARELRRAALAGAVEPGKVEVFTPAPKKAKGVDDKTWERVVLALDQMLEDAERLKVDLASPHGKEWQQDRMRQLLEDSLPESPYPELRSRRESKAGPSRGPGNPTT
jgi:hypothetical protein